MLSSALLPLLAAGLAYALPQAASSCVTVTSEVIVPTSTATYTTTDVTTIYATTAENLGTFTVVTTLSSTKTLATITSTSTTCAGGSNSSTSTIYTTSGATAAAVATSSNASAAVPTGYGKRSPLALYPRQDSACTLTTYSTTTYGATYTFVAAPSTTNTFTDYTAFSQSTVVSTTTGGTTYTIATATASAVATCAATVTQDARCAPSALVSESQGYGLEYADYTPAGGASYTTSTADGSQCCQLCAETESCAASSWDVRTGECYITLPVDYSTGDMNCGEGMLAFYDAGPDSPMAPGAGLFVAALCGSVEYGSAAPDDGT